MEGKRYYSGLGDPSSYPWVNNMSCDGTITMVKDKAKTFQSERSGIAKGKRLGKNLTYCTKKGTRRIVSGPGWEPVVFSYRVF